MKRTQMAASRAAPFSLLLSIGTLSPLMAPTPAHAFGLGDVLGAAITATAKLGGAAIDKAVDAAKDSFRDPAAEEAERKKKEQEIADKFNKIIDEIEARPELTPLQREWEVRRAQIQYSNVIAMTRFAALAEERRRAERDKIFTASGLLGVAVDSAAAMPSVAMAQADRMVKQGVPQQHTREVMSRIDNKGNVSGPGIVDAVAAAHAANQTQAAIAGAQTQVRAQMDAMVSEAKKEPMPEVGAKPAEDDFFAPDRGRKLYVEFVGSKKLTERLRSVLTQRAYTLVSDQAQADVTYRIEGEFIVPETALNEGVKLDVGKYFDDPQPVTLTEKTSGKIKQGLFNGLMAFAGKGKVAQAPKEIPQAALVVAARLAKGAKEYRISGYRREEYKGIEAEYVINSALDELMTKLGAEIRKAPIQPVADATPADGRTPN